MEGSDLGCSSTGSKLSRAFHQFTVLIRMFYSDRVLNLGEESKIYVFTISQQNFNIRDSRSLFIDRNMK